MSKMLRERGGALEFRMEKIKGGKLVIDHETNTFKVVAKDDIETTLNTLRQEVNEDAEKD